MSRQQENTEAMAKNGDETDPSVKASASVDIGAVLRQRMHEFSPSEQVLGAYMMDNMQLLPFETGSSLARAVGVSEMTVTRFVRGLGFENMRHLKKTLRN